MKAKKVSLGVCTLVLIANTYANAAEIYNKDGAKLDLYGLVDGLHYFSNDSSQDGDQTYIRFGFRGETEVNDFLTGYGQWQGQLNANTPEEGGDFYSRYAFAGVKINSFGSFDYGRNTGILYDALAYTDMQPEFDSMTYNADQFLFNRTNGVATYRNTDFFGLVDGLSFALQYQGKNDGGGEPGVRDVLTQNGDGYGMSINYDIGYGVSIAGAFASSDRTNEQNSRTSGIMGHGDHADAYSAALRYSANDIYVAVMYTQAYNASRFGSTSSRAFGYANKSRLLEAYASYTFDFGLVPFVAYNQTHASDLDNSLGGGSYGSKDIVKFVDLGATYYFNKNTSAYVDYKINLIDDNAFANDADISTDNIVAVGLQYQF
ncbi:porin OmpC [Trabulsiella odontotermitis]|uniref:porin OmpC n=1 Tax=Trabulsiella odontotermitis TaxID=379893 RepID=UPI000675E76C|nr:porin OmpC [Trabulsiella odontotermitis]KNC89212.1 membrane protein [Trabulsiella odontotermitis]